MQTIYFSERLLCQLERLHTVPLTLVEAPAGYGKTTALKHALRDVPYGALRWHNAQDATVCCDWLVRQIAQKDSALAQQIFDLYHENGPLVHAKPAEESSLYLMIDNFQVIAAQFPFSVLQLLSALKGTAVHVIFLSRSFWQLPIQDLMHVCYISKKDFFLRKEDIICFAEELGISLTEKQAIHIQKETGGWAAVVSLYLQNGCEEVEWKKLSRLMEDLFWRRQEDILKKALLRLAQFETVDVEMVRALTEDIADLQQMGEWFYSLPLLYYDAEQQRYCLCALLRKFLLYRLHNASFLTQWDSYHRCGCWYREHGETKKAVAAFYKVLDYAGILSCDLTGLLFEKFDKLSYTEIAGEILRHCPMETKQRYPLSLLRLCYALFADAAFTEYQQLLEEAKGIICDGNDPNLLGEWELIAAFQDFPNLEKLILYVGVEDYGFEADIEIFRPLFSKERFPKLTYLGLVNSEEQDSIVEMFLESDILPQLETMDISAGTLKDEGAQLLLDNMDKIAHLKFINMRYNYLSKEMKKQLQSLPMKIDIAETEEADEYDGELWYYPMITE